MNGIDMRDNHFAAVGAVVIKDGKVLLVRHIYGAAAGKLLNPGGFLKQGELPYDALIREVQEETGVTVEPVGMLSLRCSAGGWYMAIYADYISGEPKSDGNENNEALFMDCRELLQRQDATDTVKTLVRLALEGKMILMTDAGKGRVMFAPIIT